MNIAVCDDELVIREQIREMILFQSAGHRVELFCSAEELLQSEICFDVILMDIQMEGLNGIEAARVLRKRGENAVLIFVTGIKEYVFEAFDVAAFHYLLKPVDGDKFYEVFNKAVKEAEKNKEQEYLFIKSKNKKLKIRTEDILYIESMGRKVEVHLKSEIIEIYAKMNDLEEQLGNGFYRCHRGYLVNMAHITEYENYSIRVSNGETIFMAKERYNQFVREYMWYLRNGGTVCV